MLMMLDYRLTPIRDDGDTRTFACYDDSGRRLGNVQLAGNAAASEWIVAGYHCAGARVQEAIARLLDKRQREEQAG